VTRVESSNSVKNVIRVDSPSFLDVTRVTLSLFFRGVELLFSSIGQHVMTEQIRTSHCSVFEVLKVRKNRKNVYAVGAAAMVG